MLANSKNIRPLLRKCIHELEKVDELIGRKQEQALTAYLNRASLFRKKIQ